MPKNEFGHYGSAVTMYKFLEDIAICILSIYSKITGTPCLLPATNNRNYVFVKFAQLIWVSMTMIVA